MNIEILKGISYIDIKEGNIAFETVICHFYTFSFIEMNSINLIIEKTSKIGYIYLLNVFSL